MMVTQQLKYAFQSFPYWKGLKGLLLLSGIAIHCNCQPFSKLHDIDSTHDWGFSIFLKPDNSYSVLGQSEKLGMGIMHVRISTDGTTVANKKIVTKSNSSHFLAGGSSGGRVRKTINGKYVIPVSVTYPKPPVDFYMSAGVIVFDEDGNTVLTRTFTDTSKFYEAFYSIEIMPDGGFLLGGSQSDGGGINTRKGLLIRTDSFGNEIWRKTYQHAINSVQLLEDGKLLIGAMQSSLVYVGLDFYYRSLPVFILADSANGNIQKDVVLHKWLTTGSITGRGGIIHKDNNGGYYHFGLIDRVVNGNIEHPQSFPEYVAHLDDNFTIDWIDTLNPADGHNYIANVKQLKDSSYLIIGSSNRAGLSYVSTGWAAQIDKFGKLMWDNTYVVDKNHDAYLMDGVELPSGEFVFTGTARDGANPSWQQSDIWMLRVDSNGCLIPGCTPTFVKDVAEENAANITIYPNPNTGSFIFTSKEKGTLALYNMQGQELADQRITEEQTVVIMPSSLPAGIYYARFITDTGVSTTIKLEYRH